jgi:hypothetical protein
MSWRKREWSLATKVRYASDGVQLDVLEALGHEACERDRRQYGVKSVGERVADAEQRAHLHARRADAYAEWLAEHDDGLNNYAGELRSKARDLERMSEKVWDLLSEYGDEGWLYADE